jgi:UTP--glucose-1-phosphate uridylyltransferase
LKAKRKLRKAVIPAAGMGTRVQHLNQGLPKEMLPIGGRPMISYAIEEAACCGVEEVYIVINKRKDALRGYLESGDFAGQIRLGDEKQGLSLPRLQLVDQPQALGSGEAIFRVKELVGEGPFALLMPDFIFFGRTPALSQLLPLYERSNTDIVGLIELKGKEARGFGNVGIVQGEETEPGIVVISSLSGKVASPLRLGDAEQVLKAIPRGILGSHFFAYLERTKGEGEWDDTPAWQMLCEERKVVGKILAGRGFDVGNPVGYEAARAFATQLDACDKR